MAYGSPETPVPFYRPVAPEIAQVRPLPEGDLLGGNLIAAFTQRAIAAENAKIDQQRMLQTADLAAKQLSFDREKLGDDYELRSKALGIDQQRADDLRDAASRRLDLDEDLQKHRIPLLDAQTEYTKSTAKLYSNAFVRNLAFASKQADFLDQAGKDAEELGLYDSAFQTEHPMQYAKNALGFERMYGATTDPKLKATIKKFVDQANASKVTLDGKQYSWAQVAQDIELNKDTSAFVDALKRGGYFHAEMGEETVAGTTSRTPNPVLKRILEDEMGGTPIKKINEIKAKVDPFAPKNATEALAKGMITPADVTGAAESLKKKDQAAGESSSPDLPEPEIDPVQQEADFVKQKMASDPDNAASYRERFLQRNPGRDDLLQ